MRTPLACTLFSLVAAVAVVAAEPKPAQPQAVTHRITGLFWPDREADLRVTLEKLPGVELVSVDFDYAEATFRYDPAVAFAGTKLDDIAKRFDEKIRAASNGTFGVKPLSGTPHDKLTRVEIPVVGLDCRACSLAAYEAVAKLDGVEQATANFREGRVTALIDPTKTDRAKLETALKEKRIEVKQP
jgi:copper chaperone CopZ